MFLIALSPIKDETMKTIQEPITRTPIFIGRWTPHILFSLKEKPLSTWRVAPPSRRGVTADADQNSARSRILLDDRNSI